MQIPRRLLPSIPLLTAFESAARLGSVSAAARELSLTQSAVSRQIRALEEQLGADLFVRERQAIRPTLAGISYARDIRHALRRISTASLNFRANPAGGTLNLAVLPTFGAKWLVRRLPLFASERRDILLNLASRQDEPDFRVEPVDAAIYYGRPEKLGLEYQFLCADVVQPFCSPSLKRKYGFKKPEDLRKAPLLIHLSRPDGWERWLTAQGAPAEGVHGMMFDQFALIIEAAAASLGVALIPTMLASDAVARRELVPAVKQSVRSEEAYYLVWPMERAMYPPLVAFRNWLAATSDEALDGTDPPSHSKAE